MLFYDQIENNLPSITDKDKPKFKEIRERLKMSFQRYESIEQMREGLTSDKNLDFDKIKESQMSFCEDKQEMRIKLKGILINRLRGKVNDLMHQQNLHTSRVMRLIFELFNEKAVRAGNFEINDYILSNGMDALNKLAERARDLLIDYYSGCEKTYKEGLFEIRAEGSDKKPLEFVPAPSKIAR